MAEAVLRGGVRLPRARLVATATLCIVLVLAAIALHGRSARPDAGASLADAVTTLAAGNYSAARAHAQAAVSAEPGRRVAHAVLARAYLELGDGLAAEGELGRARDAGLPAARTHQLMAEARLLQGDADGALVEAARAAPRYRDYAARIRARSLAVRGDRAAAESVLVALLARAPQDAAAWRDLGRLRLSAGNIGGAADAAARSVATDARDPAALTLQGEIVRGRYGPVAALPWFAAALKRDAYHYPALIEQAATLGEVGRYRAMLAATRAALAAQPGSPQALYLQAVLAARAGRDDLARRLLQATGGAIDGLPGVLLLGGALDLSAGQYEQATTKWRRLTEMQPLNVAARRLLGMALLRSGDARGSMAVLRPIAVRGDADAYTLTLVARAAEAIGDRAFAATMLDRAAADSRGGAAAFASDDAVGALAAGVQEAPDDPSYAVGLIRGLLDSGEAGQAVARAGSLAAAGPGAPAGQLAYGDTLAATGRYAPAVAAYARAANLIFDAPTMLRLAVALGRCGRAQVATAALALFLAQNPESVVARRIAGHWQVTGGQFDAAIETLDGVRAATGGRDPGLLADLALAYAGAGEGEVARVYGRAAYALAPMNAAVVEAYGRALTVAGDAGGARQLRAKAAALNAARVGG